MSEYENECYSACADCWMHVEDGRLKIRNHNSADRNWANVVQTTEEGQDLLEVLTLSPFNTQAFRKRRGLRRNRRHAISDGESTCHVMLMQNWNSDLSPLSSKFQKVERHKIIVRYFRPVRRVGRNRLGCSECTTEWNLTVFLRHRSGHRHQQIG